ncbi:MAG: NAD-dependent epimerase/dehydratase family protein [Chitinophagaceae bacterium]|nr:NAD-dependent epimerase/dehydratase family protein [Chitinophagaceae bacterium]
MSIHTILGAGGIIAEGLTRQLLSHQVPVRLVSRHPSSYPRHPSPHPGAQLVAADITNASQTLEAIKNSAVVYCCIGLKYDYSVWRHAWPLIMNNIIDACRQTKARLIFFDNVYMYGRVEGAMTEDTPYDPDSRKGDLRARIATQLMSEVRKGNITASIARAADFYGPGADKTSVLNLLVFQRLSKNKKAQWLVNPHVRHSFTYTEDAAKALYLLGNDENSWNQAWHLPTAAGPLTGEEYITAAATALDSPVQNMMVLSKWMVRLGGLFDKTTAELNEMLYQYEYDYLFDSSKFEKAYDFQPVSYAEGIYATANAYKKALAS